MSWLFLRVRVFCQADHQESIVRSCEYSSLTYTMSQVSCFNMHVVFLQTHNVHSDRVSPCTFQCIERLRREETVDLAIILTVGFLLVFLMLALLLIKALRTPKEKYDPNHLALPPQSSTANPNWKNMFFKMLVMRPWPYRDLYNPLNRLYWPDEQQQDNRSRRRCIRRKKKR